MLSDMDRQFKDLALLCINDDVAEDHDEITSYFLGWQEKKWGTPAAWEADAGHRRRSDEDEEDETAGLGRREDDAGEPIVYQSDPRY